MTDDKRIDESISRLVQGIQLDIPPSVEEDIKKRTAGSRLRPVRPAYRRLLWTLLPSGAALILGVLLLLRAPMEPPVSDFSEIRTQFEIVDKNITMVFYQRIPSSNIKEN
jgi:hypothetical protein